MGSNLPKQYLSVLGKTVLEHSIGKMLEVNLFQHVIVILSPDDSLWERCSYARDSRVTTVSGGSTRAESVGNALKVLAHKVSSDDWVLIHDAARPCVTGDDVRKLAEARSHFPQGCILAAPVADTLKQVNDAKQITATLPREQLWRALTPQLFPCQQLASVVFDDEQSMSYTDEAMAMEAAGYTPGVVEGSSENIKITRADDLALAEFILRRQSRQ